MIGLRLILPRLSKPVCDFCLSKSRRNHHTRLLIWFYILGLPSTPGFKRFPLSPPTISPKLEPYEPQSPLTSDNDDDDLPKIEDLLASTRPDFTPKQSQTQVRMQNSFSKNGRSSLSSQSANRERDGTTMDVDGDSSSPAAGSSSRPARPTPSNSPQKTDMPKTPVNVSGIPSSALSASGSTQSQPLSARPKPQAKRKRAELEEPPTQTPTTSAKRSKTGKLLQFRKHSTYWLLDGNVVLQIKKYRFKLHRSRLVKHSALFDKMFESQRDIEEVVEGYPLYPLDKFGIELEDFETLLDGLDDAMYISSLFHDFVSYFYNPLIPQQNILLHTSTIPHSCLHPPCLHSPVFSGILCLVHAIPPGDVSTGPRAHISSEAHPLGDRSCGACEEV